MIGKLLSLDRSFETLLPALLGLLDVTVADSPWERLDPQQSRRLTIEGVKRLLLRESQVQPVMVLFEDLHWVDAETQTLLDSLIESIPTARLLLLVNYRPEYQHGWAGKTYYSQLRFDPLPAESAAELLQTLMGDDLDLQPLRALLIGQTEGNPLFLEETVRALVETQVLLGQRGAYRLATGFPRIHVPPTVQAVLAARIDRLPSEEKRILQAAAVIGEDVPFAVLHVIVEEPEEVLRRGLMHRQAAEFLYEVSLFPDLVYTFKHGLTYQVAYGSMLQSRPPDTAHESSGATRATLFQPAHGARRTAGPPCLPRSVWNKAVTYLRQASAKAQGRSAHRQALACLEEALEALHHLPETRETREQEIDVRLELRGSL